MSQLVNQLSGYNRQQSFLEGLAHPQVLNPLAAMQSAAQAAGSIYDVRSRQAQQVWGQALAKNTDAQGNVDYAGAQRDMANSGTVGAYGMPTAVGQASQLRGQQITNAADAAKVSGAGWITVASDPSDANILNVRNDMIARGLPQAQVDAEYARVKAMSPQQRVQYATRNGLFALDQLHSAVPRTAPENLGGVIGPVTTTPTLPGYTPGAVSGGAGGVTTTMSPSEAANLPGIKYPATQEDLDAGRATTLGQDVHVSGIDMTKRFGYGALLPPGAQVEAPQGGGGGAGAAPNTSTGKPASPSNQPHLRAPGAAAPANAPPAAPAFPTVAPIAPGQGTGTPPMPVGPVAPAGARGGPVVPTTALPVQGPALASAGAGGNPLQPPGVQVAGPIAPALGPPGQPSANVPGDVAAIQAGMAGAQAAGPSRGPQVAATVAAGPGYEGATTGKAAADRAAQDDTLVASYNAGLFPQASTLNLYGRGMTTAPGSDFWNGVKGYFGGMLRSMGVEGAGSSTEPYDAIHKFMAQSIINNPAAAGSDARLAETLAGNANTGIHELAGADMVKAGIALQRMQATARSEWTSMSPQDQAKYGGNYNRYLGWFNKNTDIRGFAWDMYNPHQVDDLAADLAKHVGKNDGYAQKLLDTVEMARRNGYMGDLRALPSPQ